MSLPLIAILVIFPAAMAYAAASDIVTMTISNRLCLLLVAAFAICAISLGLSWSQIGWHLAAGVIVLLVGIALFAAGWVGGGDAKLVAATALWFGFEPLLPYLMVTAIAGGVLTLLLHQLRQAPLPGPAANWAWAKRLHGVQQGVPYGVALAFGALAVLPQTAIWRAAIGL
ncbi:MAG TPA: prepilin peptidase [Bosea sp. (in: a-proteobacteria)]|jgi:prepilin peptidase CpaA|uniref:A24 family peptidase n=1 Tax=Bosea sp. (in: a-proteobacteria) TaxID=1871050 RepID=UPI002E12326E|nr:prepilin peptidase [Bosea sp. (in: a-proteobacteria)]